MPRIMLIYQFLNEIYLIPEFCNLIGQEHSWLQPIKNCEITIQGFIQAILMSGRLLKKLSLLEFSH